MGNIWSLGTMNNCYAVGYQLSANVNNFYPVSNIYSTEEETVAGVKPTVLTAAQMKGAEAIANMAFNRLDWDFRYNDYPVPCVRANGYDSGEGTVTNPFITKTEAQLKYLVNDTETLGKYYKLANNIVVNESLEGNPKLWFMTAYGANDVPVGATFNGNLDGDGNTVSGIFYNGSSTGANPYWASVGLIPRAGKDAIVSNIVLVKSSLTLINGGTAGSIVGLMWYDNPFNNFKVSGCFADETVTLAGDADLGGITGRLVGHGVISDCYFTGNLASGNNNNATYAGGWSHTRTVEKFYTTSPISITSDVYYNGVYTTETAVTSTTPDGGSTTQITLESIKGETAKNALSGFDFSNIWRLTYGYPTLLKHYQAQLRAAARLLISITAVLPQGFQKETLLIIRYMVLREIFGESATIYSMILLIAIPLIIHRITPKNY